MNLIFDLETDGLLDSVTQIHSLAILNVDNNETQDFKGAEILSGLEILSEADLVIGHNILCFDLPVLKKVLNWDYSGEVYDTLTVSRLIYTNLLEIDFSLQKIPKKLYGGHSLEAWGNRLGEYKGDFKGPWDKWTQEMQDYCIQDTLVTKKLYDKLIEKNYSERAIRIEHEFQKIIHIQETNGILFDSTKAGILAKRIRESFEQIGRSLSESLPIQIKRGPVFTPKRDNEPSGYRKGSSFNKISFHDFNPGSRQQIERYFKRKYSWQPSSFTDKGNPKLDDEVFRELEYPEAKQFARYFERSKILGFLETGKNAWLKLQKNGRIYGRVITNGAVTGRCTHSTPNLAQVPSVRGYMGKECRELFHAGFGWMIGADASGLELRMLAHYLHRYDGGRYAKEIITGDIHTANQRAAGLDSRDTAKTFIYAYLYGAGDGKLGSIVTNSKNQDENKRVGKELRKRFLSKTAGLKELQNDVRNKASIHKFLRGLDGRHLHIRSDHKALNTLLQGAGAVIMKQANVQFWEWNQQDCQQVLNVHDEWEVVTHNKLELDNIGVTMVDSIVKAGKDFELNIPLDGEYKIGKNWAEVH